jgi:aldehyde dehydrogenase (NAD+)
MMEQTEGVNKQARAFSGFDGQYIDGAWRAGRSGNTLKDIDPYTNDTLAEITLADKNDLGDAYRAAEKAQPDWARMLPGARGGVRPFSAPGTDLHEQQPHHRRCQGP